MSAGPTRDKSGGTPPYNPAFYRSYVDESQRSARVVAPLALGIVQARSVVDVGCGIGTWLRAFREAGVERIQGVDGEYVDRRQLLIDESAFQAHDLTQPLR